MKSTESVVKSELVINYIILIYWKTDEITNTVVLLKKSRKYKDLGKNIEIWIKY